MTDPSFVTLLVTITPMNCGTVGGGFELLPGRDVQVWPHVGAALPSSQPSNASGAEPVLVGLLFAHCAPQKLTRTPGEATRSPTTNAPPAGNANGWHASPMPSPLVSR